MITLRKLKSLPAGTRVRKTLRLVEQFEKELREGRELDSVYLTGVLTTLIQDIDSGEAVEVAGEARHPGAGGRWRRISELRIEATELEEAAVALRGALEGENGRDEQLRGLNGVRHMLLSLLSMEPGEWDLLEPATAPSGPRPQRLFEVVLYLEEIRSPFNLGSIARSAEAFGAAGLILSPTVPAPEHPRARRGAMGAFDNLPLRRCEQLSAAAGAATPGDELAVFALEAGGTPIGEFDFPDRGICLLGSEELGLSPGALALAEASAGRCTIPLYGSKGSLNVGVATGILLSHWTEALLQRAEWAEPASGGGEKKSPAEVRQGLFESLTDSFCHGLS